MGAKNIKTYPPELRQILERAESGEAGALPALSAAFDEHPELAEKLGDMAAHAESALLHLATRSSPVGAEAVKRHLRELRETLNASAGTELERLLVTRVTLDWLVVQHATMDLAGHLDGPGTSPAAIAAQKRLDRAHARYLASTKALAAVGKLLRRAPSPLDLLRVQVDAQTPTQARTARRFEIHAAAAN